MPSPPPPHPSDTAPIYFWNPHDGRYHQFLSQWYPVTFTDASNTTYTTTEQYMMYQKALLFADRATASQILATTHPEAAKRLGRSVQNFHSPIWNQHKVSIVAEGNYLKFSQGVAQAQDSEPSPEPGTPLKQLLLETGDRELVEASSEDRVWGIGVGVEDAPGSRREEWGENLLGRALMGVRARIREEDEGREKGAL